MNKFPLGKAQTNDLQIQSQTRCHWASKSENLKNKFSDIDVVDWGETPAADVVINVTSLGLNHNDKIDLDYDKIKF